MGLNDTEEMLEACKADTLNMERALARISRRAEQRLRSEHASVTDAGHWADIKRMADDAINSATA